MLGAVKQKDEDIEKDFLESWNQTEQFFASFEHEWARDALKFIALLRSRELDYQLRTGQALNMLILSRSRIHGLRPEQAKICFGFENQKLAIYKTSLKPFKTFDSIELTDELWTMLNELVAQPID